MNKMIHTLKKRFSLNDERGFTLLEMVIAVVIFGLLTTMIFNLFQTSRETTENVQSGSTSIAQAQTATGELAKKIRNASKVKVATNGNRLDLENSDGTCTSWVYDSGKLYLHEGSTAAVFANSWKQRLPEASLTSTGRFFSELTDGVSYSFLSGNGVGAKKMEGESYMRLPSASKTSICFGDAPVTPTPSPSPVVTPTPVPPTVYEIGYELAGGTVSGNPTSYTSATATFTLNNPTRTGYNFAGWTGTGLTSSTTTVVINSGSTGTRTYTATWTAIPAPTPTPTPTPTTPASDVNLKAIYSADQSWGSGGNISIKVTATANQANNWKMIITVPSGTSLSPWHADCSQSGNQVTCIPKGWNGTYTSGQSNTFGFGFNGGNPPTSLTVTFAKR